MKRTLTISFSLPKIPNVELVAVQALEQLCNYWNVPEDKIGEARVLVTEAIINAFEHSGKQDPKVTARFVLGKSKLNITIHDNGVGFDISTVSNPDINEKINSKSKRGWGIKLMRSMSDDFTIESNTSGTTIKMTKKFK